MAALAAGAGAAPANAATRRPELHAAVAANAQVPLLEIAAAFEDSTGVHVVVSTGSTGKLYAQARNGAPYQVFVAADTLYPSLLERDGFGVAGSRCTYGRGRLVLWSADPQRVTASAQTLVPRAAERIAIANPQAAPYGAAALDVLRRLGRESDWAGRMATGESLAQTLVFAESGNAALGFIALSQLRDPALEGRGSAWMVPDSLYAPIVQQAIALRNAARAQPARPNPPSTGSRGAGTDPALQFLAFLRRPYARGILERFGYECP